MNRLGWVGLAGLLYSAVVGLAACIAVPASTSSTSSSTRVTAPTSASASPHSADVPFAVELSGQSYEGIAILNSNHIVGQLVVFGKPVNLNAEINGNTVSARLTGNLYLGVSNFGAPCLESFWKRVQ